MDFKNVSKEGVKFVQSMLNIATGAGLFVDGIAGPRTERAYKSTGLNYFELKQEYLVKSGLGIIDGNNQEYAVFIGAGHSGIDPITNKYPTAPAKMYKHENIQAHKSGVFYEGHENRIIAEMLIKELNEVGINAIRLYHPYKDTSPRERANMYTQYIKRGYYGPAIDLHSNAIDTRNKSLNEIEKVRGGTIFTSKAETISDILANIYIESSSFKNWTWSRDFEQNFSFLKYADLGTPDTAAILEEFGFFTSSIDTEFIINNRQIRVEDLSELLDPAFNGFRNYMYDSL